ncbi:MAG TPA: TOBE domain-containing protein [Chloroflexota bacterium]|nr:TOBE domain-containing protein [Chloroflexota bacterium]
MALKTSARNQLPGVVTAVRLGNVMAQVEIQVGENRIVAAITRDAVVELDLKEADRVVAIIKATEVMVGKLDGAEASGGA